jgi:hypothetical protein
MSADTRGSRILASSNVSIPDAPKNHGRRHTERQAELGFERRLRTRIYKDGRDDGIDVDVDALDRISGKSFIRNQIQARRRAWDACRRTTGTA